MDQHTNERRFARCSHLWDAARNFRQHHTPEIDQAARHNRIKTNLISTGLDVAYYGGTIGSGLAFYHLLNNHGPIAITALIVFVVVVEGVLRTLLSEVLDTLVTDQADDATAAVSLAQTQETAR